MPYQGVKLLKFTSPIDPEFEGHFFVFLLLQNCVGKHNQASLGLCMFYSIVYWDLYCFIAENMTSHRELSDSYTLSSTLVPVLKGFATGM